MSIPPNETSFFWRYSQVFRYTRRAMILVWETSKPLTFAFALLTIISGLLPATMAWVGKEIIDSVLLAIETATTESQQTALLWIAAEALLVTLTAAARRGIQVCDALLRAQLSNQVNVIILEKALTLDLSHFENAEFYDKMTRARRQASTRPLSLVKRAFRFLQYSIALVTYGAILIQFSWYAVALLIIAAIPPFLAETRFAEKGFQLFRWQSTARREQMYLETVVAREDYAKEVMLLGIGPQLVQRYQTIFDEHYHDDKKLVLQRGFWGFTLGILATLVLYGSYGWIALTAIAGTITIGTMTMYLAVFKQGQSAFTGLLQQVGGMYEDNLYLSNLYEYLAQQTNTEKGDQERGPLPEDGIRFENVSFRYPGAKSDAIKDMNLHIKAGQKLAIVGHNGSGKTTLIKLLAGLYRPQQGQILLDGLDIQQWKPAALYKRIGIIFQDFIRYQFTVGENIGVGDAQHLHQPERWAVAAKKGMANEFVEQLPDKYQTRLGRWFGGRELSLGQWQKVALARAFMNQDADILVLDEPTAAMDAEAEAQIFERFQQLAKHQLAILISHRFSTVRMADTIVVLDQGRLVEHGNHTQLMAAEGKYAQLFHLQAQGYIAADQ